MTQPSGWYDDPQDPTQVRYFDGVVWTERVSPKVNPNLDRSSIGSPQPPTAGGAEGVSSGPGRGQNPPDAQPHHDPYAPAPGPDRGHYQGPYPGHGGQWHGQGNWPGAPMQQQFPMGPTTPDGQPLSGWWRRVLARIVDGIIVALICVPFTFWSYSSVEGALQEWLDDVMAAVRSGSTTAPPMPDEIVRYVAIISVISFLIYAVYEVFFLSRTGATPGKRVAGISVRLRDRPGPVPAGMVLRRYVVKEGGAVVGLLPVLGLFGTLFMLVNYLWPLWDRDKQALHDKVVATNVVLGPQPKRATGPGGGGWRPGGPTGPGA